MLCCVVDLEPCLLSCPGSSAGRALCLESGVSWVRVPPRAAPLKKELSWLHPLIHESWSNVSHGEGESEI